jgi:hypothetical protein
MTVELDTSGMVAGILRGASSEALEVTVLTGDHRFGDKH